MKNFFLLYYLLYLEFSSKFVNKKVNSRQGYLITKNKRPMAIYKRTKGCGRLSFKTFYFFLLFLFFDTKIGTYLQMLLG